MIQEVVMPAQREREMLRNLADGLVKALPLLARVHDTNPDGRMVTMQIRHGRNTRRKPDSQEEDR